MIKKWYLLLVMILLVGCAAEDSTSENKEPIKEDVYLEQEADKIASEFIKGDYTLYYTNENRTTLEETTCYFNFSGTSLSKEIESILNSLANIRSLDEVEDLSAYSIIPDGMVTEYAIETQDIGNIVKIYMSEDFYQMKPNAVVVMETGINKSIYNLGLISSIEYYVKEPEGSVLVDYSTSSELVLLNQYDNNFYTDDVTMKLYYGDSSKEGLIKEEREVTLKMTDTMQEAVVKELINGSQIEGTLNLIPEGTRINSVWIKNGICYVDFSSDFQTRFVGSVQEEKLLIYSIVNSLCGLSGIDYVQILIDGERIDIFYSDVSINSPLQKDETIVLTRAE